jgi:hypothetical protein
MGRVSDERNDSWAKTRDPAQGEEKEKLEQGFVIVSHQRFWRRSNLS